MTVSVNPANISGATVTFSKKGPYTYTGEGIRPEITVTYNNKSLTKGTDYDVEYSDNVQKSENAKVKVIGKGNYTDSISNTFAIDYLNTKGKYGIAGQYVGEYGKIWVNESGTLTVTPARGYSLCLKDFEITIEENTWTTPLSIENCVAGETPNPKATAKCGKPTFTYSSEENGEYKTNIPETAGTWYVKATVVGKERTSDEEVGYKGLEATTSFTINGWKKPLYVNESYDYNEEIKPQANAYFGKVKFEYSSDGQNYTDQAPKDVGEYYVKAVVKGDNGQNVLESETASFKITKAVNGWIKKLYVKKSYAFGEKVEPEATAKFQGPNEPTFTYSSEKDGTYTDDVPEAAGTWYVKAKVVGTDNYKGLESNAASFEIKKVYQKTSLKDLTIQANLNGAEIVKVTDKSGKALVQGEDYEVDNEKNSIT